MFSTIYSHKNKNKKYVLCPAIPFVSRINLFNQFKMADDSSSFLYCKRLTSLTSLLLSKYNYQCDIQTHDFIRHIPSQCFCFISLLRGKNDEMHLGSALKCKCMPSSLRPITSSCLSPEKKKKTRTITVICRQLYSRGVARGGGPGVPVTPPW